MRRFFFTFACPVAAMLLAVLAAIVPTRADWSDSFPGGEPDQFWDFTFNAPPVASGTYQFASGTSGTMGNLTIRGNLGTTIGYGIVPTESFAGRGVVVRSLVNPSGTIPGGPNVGVAGMVDTGPGTGYLATISTTTPGISILSLVKSTGTAYATATLASGTFGFSAAAPYTVELEALGPVVMARAFNSSGTLLQSLTRLDSTPWLEGFAGVAAWKGSGTTPASPSGNWGTTSARAVTPNGGLLWAPNGSIPSGTVATGTWTPTSLTWISSMNTSAPVRWDPTMQAIFAANGTTGGTVYVSGSTVRVEAGMRFIVGGYRIASATSSPGMLVLGGTGPVLEVDDAPPGSLQVATIDLPMTGTTGFSKARGGVLALTSTNTYTGNTAIAEGIVSISSTAALPGWNVPGRYQVSQGAALAVRNGVADSSVVAILATGNVSGGSLGFDTVSGNRTYGLDITGSVGLRKIGPDRLTLTGTNTYSLGTVVSEGQLEITSTSALPGWDQARRWTVDLGAVLVAPNSITQPQVTDILATANVGDGGFGFDTSAGNRTYAPSILGSLSLYKLGTNTLILTGSSTFSGSTSITQGTLQIGQANALGNTIQPVSVASGATLALDGGIAVGPKPLTVLGGTGTLRSVTGSNSYAGGLSLGGDTALASGSGAVLKLSGTIGRTGTVAPNLSLLGPGTLVLSGTISDLALGTVAVSGGALARLTGTANSYTGQTRIDDGILEIVALANSGSASSIGTGASSPTIVIGGSATTGTLRHVGSGTAATNRNVSIGAGGGRIESDGTGAMIFTAGTFNALIPSVTTSSTLTLGGGNTSTNTIQGVIRNTSAAASLTLVKNGAGTWILTGSNTYSGGTLVSAGTLRGDTTSLQGAITNNATVVFDQNTAGTYAGIMSGSGSLTKSGTGTLTLSNINTFSGSTTVQEGTLQLANGSALASSRIVPLAGGTLTMSPGLQATVGGLAANAGGLIDVGNGLMTVVTGLSAADMLTALLAGRGDGSWNGSDGITSSAAAAALSVSTPRTVGWLDNGDGSVTFAFAAPGDTNLDWTVDILDAANFLAGGKFDSGQPATWNEGDFGYDGVVDILDAADFLSTNLFDAGPYNPPAGTAAGIAAVPEPSLGATVVFVAVATSWFVRRRMVGQIRGAKFSGDVSKA